jgi:DNA-binding NarL/FixJ family response regulator
MAGFRLESVQEGVSIVRVLVADDHAISRSGLEFLLSGEPDLELVGSAADGDQALALTQALTPDLVILDLMLPKKPGLVVLEQIKRLDPCPHVVAISGQASGLIFRQAFASGADAVVSKEDSSEELLAAIDALRRGESFRSSKVTKLLGVLDSTGGDPALTAREREVLSLIAAGYSNDQIGTRLHISPKTAKKHRENIRRKLGVSNAVEAARMAARLGLEPVG